MIHCKICNKRFDPTSNRNTMYCSLQCRYIARKIRAKEAQRRQVGYYLKLIKELVTAGYIVIDPKEYFQKSN